MLVRPAFQSMYFTYRNKALKRDRQTIDKMNGDGHFGFSSVCISSCSIATTKYSMLCIKISSRIIFTQSMEEVSRMDGIGYSLLFVG